MKKMSATPHNGKENSLTLLSLTSVGIQSRTPISTSAAATLMRVHIHLATVA